VGEAQAKVQSGSREKPRLIEAVSAEDVISFRERARTLARWPAHERGTTRLVTLQCSRLGQARMNSQSAVAVVVKEQDSRRDAVGYGGALCVAARLKAVDADL
jgi:hypothetical protein